MAEKLEDDHGHAGCGVAAAPGAPESAYPLLSIAEATRIILEATSTLPPVQTSLREALGLILAEDVKAPEPLPPFPASIKDGYAVVAADGPGDYPIVGEARAGDDATELLVRPGTVAYITTGGPMPKGADAVVQVENTMPLPNDDRGTARVRIVKGAKQPGEDVRQVGSDIAGGALVLKAGERLAPGEIGLLATVGAVKVKTFPKPTVAVLSTGDELVDSFSKKTLGRGQIRDANRAMLLAAATEAGCHTVDLGIALDKELELEAKLELALKANADVFVTTGGVSMGDKDLVKPLLERHGKVFFGRVLMKPGKPLTFARIERGPGQKPMLAFGLPGNPVSSIVTFNLAVIPSLRKMAGWAEPALRRVEAVLAQPLPLDNERPEYHRAVLRWQAGTGFLAESTGRQISSRLLSMRSAAALLELPRGSGTLPAGTRVTALLLSNLTAMPPSEVPLCSAAAATDPPPPQRGGHSHGHKQHGGNKVEPPGGVVKAAILTVSDTVAGGKGTDRGGPAAVKALEGAAKVLGVVKVVAMEIVPDEVADIQRVLRKWSDELGVDLVLTTGGTGLSPRDVTPEATKGVLDKEAYGLAHTMMTYSLSITPFAMLSRMLAGVRKQTLILNLPGNPNAIGECLDAIMGTLPHALKQIRGDKKEKHPLHVPHNNNGGQEAHRRGGHPKSPSKLTIPPEGLLGKAPPEPLALASPVREEPKQKGVAATPPKSPRNAPVKSPRGAVTPPKSPKAVPPKSPKGGVGKSVTVVPPKSPKHAPMKNPRDEMPKSPQNAKSAKEVPPKSPREGAGKVGAPVAEVLKVHQEWVPKTEVAKEGESPKQ